MFDPMECHPHESKVMGLEVVSYRVPQLKTCEQPGGHELPGSLYTGVNIRAVV